MSNNSREQIDFLLIILVNVIISSQMLASLYITSKVLIQKFRNRKLSQTVPETTSEQNKQIKVLIIPSENEKMDNLSIQKLNVSPRFSCEASMLGDEPEAYTKNKKMLKVEEKK